MFELVPGKEETDLLCDLELFACPLGAPVFLSINDDTEIVS